MNNTSKNIKVAKVKQKKQIPTQGKAYIVATFNNTIVTITDNIGNTIVQKSAGIAGFKGARRSTPYAASQAAEMASKDASNMGLKEVAVIVKGAGNGRMSAIKSIKAGGLNVLSIKDETPIPHNGCRPKKRRRI